MYSRIIFVVSCVAVFAGAAGASAWTNETGDNRWCEVDNWDDVNGIPTSSEWADIDMSLGNVVVDCNAYAKGVYWEPTADGGTFTIEAGASLDVNGVFIWSDDPNTSESTVNIYGSLTTAFDPDIWGDDPCEIHHNNWNFSFRGPDEGKGIVNIFPGANIWTWGRFRGADSSGSEIDFNISGGYIDIGGFMLGDSGTGNLYMTGGTMKCRQDSFDKYGNPNPAFSIHGESGGDEIHVQLDGGAQLIINGTFMAPENAACNASIDIDDGYIQCRDWQAQGELWTMDINEGMIRYKNPPVGTKERIEEWITDDTPQITGYNGTVVPMITEDGPDLIVANYFVHYTSWEPNPTNGGRNMCPGGTISWNPGVAVATHNIYFSTDFNDVNEGGALVETGYGLNTWSPPGLELDTTYYWRVDEVNDPCVWTGGVWQFTTSDGNAFAVSPENGETGVVLDSNLIWGCCDADSYNIYFSTEFNDVNNRIALKEAAYAGTEWDPCSGGDMPYATTYYWAIDKIKGGVPSPGEVWTFRTEYNIVDPNMTLWYKLDEASGDDVEDSSGYENHGSIDGDENWRPDDGRFGGSFEFEDDAKIEIPPLATGSVDSQMSVTCWLKDSYHPSKDNWVYGFGLGDHQFRAAVALQGTSEVEFRAGNDGNDVLIWNMSRDNIDPSTLQDWHYWAFVKDEDAGNMRIYFDGVVVESNNVVASTLTNIRLRPAAIGGLPYHTNDMMGQVDDFRTYNKALSDHEVAGYFRGGEIELAWAPDPRNGAVDVDRDANLGWSAGDFAVQHDVYLGDSFDDVNDATTASAGIYRGRQDPCEYDPPGDLVLDKTYYWRIDEVNDPCVWKGTVWKFTVANYITIDDFESYDNDANRIYYTWIDFLGGSQIDLGIEPFSPAHRGTQSMLYVYDNTIKYDIFHYWSEVELPFDSPQDWTDSGVKTLTLYFYGDPGNDADETEQLYVGLGGSYAQVNCPDMNAVLNPEWTEWNIGLGEFEGVTLTAVTSLFIGFGDRNNTTQVGGDGVVYFDDIRLYPPKCVPDILKPAADLNNDCVVNWGDVRVLGEHWLRGDLDLTPVSNPGDANLVGHWELDGDANDSSVNANHGTVIGDTAWITGRIGSGAIELIDGEISVEDDGNTPELRPTDEVTAAAWAYYSASQDNASRVVVKGADNSETYGLEIDADDGFVSYVRDVNGGRYYNTSGAYRNEWMHLAVTYDGTSVKSYRNGEEVASRDEPNLSLSQDTAGFAIGDRSDANDRRFEGKVDDVRVYNRALTVGEIGWLASDGSGEVLLDSEANFYDGESPEVINMRDLGLLLLTWGEEKLWPE